MTKSVRLRAGLALGLFCAPLLAACDGLGQALGMERTAPDEGAKVATNPPLSLPPDYDLKPPRETPKKADPDSTENEPSPDPSIHHLQ